MTPKSRRLIRKREVLSRVALGYDTISRMMKRGEFPQSVRIGPKLVAWYADEIDAWIGNLQRGVSDFRPPTLVRAILDNDDD